MARGMRRREGGRAHQRSGAHSPQRNRPLPAVVLGSGGTLNVADGNRFEFTMSTCSLSGTGRVLAPFPSTYPDSPNIVQIERATLIHEAGVVDLRNVIVSLADGAFSLVAVPWTPHLRDADAAYSAHAAALDSREVRVMQEILWSADEYGGPTRSFLLPIWLWPTASPRPTPPRSFRN